ncbi:hypothetical protein V1478_009665 [Vespula squamosa]|uniref:Uncharacterized protein n=1 Tax=Vespula squamosa TaxID=30214 RepID=A0ABD2AQA1_VESSQ
MILDRFEVRRRCSTEMTEITESYERYFNARSTILRNSEGSYKGGRNRGRRKEEKEEKEEEEEEEEEEEVSTGTVNHACELFEAHFSLTYRNAMEAACRHSSGGNSRSGDGGGGGGDEEKGARWGKDSVIIRHRLEKLLPDPEIDSLALGLVVVVRVGENDDEEEGKALNSASNAKGPPPSPQIFIH